MESGAAQGRRHDLDWLRVLAVALLIPFHSGMIFGEWDFHIKNPQTSSGLTILNAFIDNWHMPLLFCLAGAATWLALHKHSGSADVRERALGLLMPFAFGVLTVVLYDVIVKRWNSLRFLFGMRPVKTI